MTILDILSRITNLRDAGSSFSIEKMYLLADALGNPQDKFKSIHVAGTNGKGSVCAMLESILRNNGYKVGLFTSPHLISITERIQINRKNILEKDFSRLFLKVEKIAKEIEKKNAEIKFSFFEYITAIGFLYFAEKKVDYAVIEVGLGGRLDATNILIPILSVVTSIALEHTNILGKSISKIAKEKGGIIKKNIPVVCGIMPNSALKTLKKIANQNESKLFVINENNKKSLETSLSGAFQYRNVLISLLCVKVLSNQIKLDDEKVECALKNVSWKGRWEEIKLKNGTLILDASHNCEGAKELEINLKLLTNKLGKKVKVITGILGKERAIPLLKVISKYACEIIFLRPKQDRALSYEDLEECLPNKKINYKFSSVEKIFSKHFCSEIEQGDTILCTGSIYLAGEVLSQLNALKNDSLHDKF